MRLPRPLLPCPPPCCLPSPSPAACPSPHERLRHGRPEQRANAGQDRRRAEGEHGRGAGGRRDAAQDAERCADHDPMDAHGDLAERERPEHHLRPPLQDQPAAARPQAQQPVHGLRGAHPAARQVPAHRGRRLPDPRRARRGRRPQWPGRLGQRPQRHRVPLHRAVPRVLPGRGVEGRHLRQRNQDPASLHRRARGQRCVAWGEQQYSQTTQGAGLATTSRPTPGTSPRSRSRRACRRTRRWPASPSRAGSWCWPRACT